MSDSIREQDIEAVQAEAQANGDQRTVERCIAAKNGDAESFEFVERFIAARRAMLEVH